MTRCDVSGKVRLFRGQSKEAYVHVVSDCHCLFGGESVYRAGTIIDRIRSAAYGYTVDKDIALVYLPCDMSVPGTELEVEVMGKIVAAQVISLPIIDPEGLNIRS